MSIWSSLASLLKVGTRATSTVASATKATSVVTKTAESVTKAGKTIINAAKGSKLVLQMGEVGGTVAKAAQAGFTASKAWVVAKWGVLAAAIVGVGVGLKNLLSGLFGSAYDGVSSILESFGLSPEQADTGTSIIFVALFVAIFLYALPYLIDRIPERKPRRKMSDKIKKTAKDDWMTITKKNDGRGEK